MRFLAAGLSLSLDTSALAADPAQVAGSSCMMKHDDDRGVDEGAVTGAPVLEASKTAGETGVLPLADAGRAGVTMFGAQDVRGGAGSAAPVQ